MLASDCVAAMIQCMNVTPPGPLRALCAMAMVLCMAGVPDANGQTINPTIVINNVTGANPPAASGAPSTFGPVVPPSLCATTGASTTIQSLGHGLGAVPTDGSAAVWMETATGRRWSRISSVPNADTFVVQDSFNIGVAVACVVGGEIAGVLANVTRLCNDLKSGWTVILENTGTTYTDIEVGVEAAGCVFAATNLTQVGNGRIVIRGDDPDNPTPILYQTNGGYFAQSAASSAKIENLHLIKDTAAGTSGALTVSGVSAVKNVLTSNSQGSWATAYGALQANPALVISSQFTGPFTTSCGSSGEADVVIGNYFDGCSGSGAAFSSTGPPALLFNIINQAGVNQPIISGSLNNGFGGILMYNTLLDGGNAGVLVGANFLTIVSGNVINEASTLGAACWVGGAGASNLFGGSGEPHTVWQGNAANVCPTARYTNIGTTPVGAATDIDTGLAVDPMFQDEAMLDYFPLNAELKSDLVVPGASFPLLTPPAPVSTLTSGAPQRPGGGGVDAYAF
jgi:hypothetical protein